jgi:hypothetical protein
MYAKTLMPSDGPNDPATPFLYVTVPHGSSITKDLIAAGEWNPLRGGIAIADGEVRIMPNSLRVVVAGQLVLQDDTSSIAPPGWWEAVDAMKGHVGIVVLPAGTPFTQPALGEAMEALTGSSATAQAIVRVVH